jgi:serine O-acetyltransferase
MTGIVLNSPARTEQLSMQWREDLAANTGKSGIRAAMVAWITSPGFVAITWWRVAKRLRASGRPGRALSWIILRRCLMNRGCYISLLAEIGPGLNLPHPTGIVVGDGVRIGRSSTIYQNVTLGRHSANRPGYPVIGDGTTVYAGAVIIGAIVIGEDAVVAANSVVNRDVAPGAVAVGAPARTVAAQ